MTAIAAAVAGMAASGFTTILICSVLGLSVDITVLSTLLAELGVGSASAYAVDRRVQRWLIDRDRRRLDRALPEARLLPGETDTHPVRHRAGG